MPNNPLYTEDELSTMPTEGGFRLRGMEMTRLETFTDAAFAFAATLLVLSIDAVPSTYTEMIEAMRGIPAFVVSLAILMIFWRAHERFSRRFGLEDGPTTILTTALIAVTLIYVYPLKFLFVQFFGWVIPALRPAGYLNSISGPSQLGGAFIIYGAGFIVLHAVLMLMHVHVLRRRSQLALSEGEVYHTRTCILSSIAYISIGAVSITLAATFRSSMAVVSAGFVYCTLAALMPTIEIVRAKRAPTT